MWDMFRKILISIVLIGVAVAVCVISYKQVVKLTEEFFATPTVESTAEPAEVE